MRSNVVNHPIQSTPTLEELKRQKFTPHGRDERIAASLAALNAPQAIELTTAEWKAIVEEEIEDQY